MRAESSATDMDSAALRWLDRVLDASPTEQARILETIRKTDPDLHRRVEGLLCRSSEDTSSQVIARLVDRSHDAVRHETALAEAPAAGAEFAAHRLIRELGRGGMSTVWLAERLDSIPRRRVAIKMPLFTLGSASDRERFARERDVLAALNHPGIAKLFEAGVASSGRPYLAIEFVEGQHLPDACDARRWNLRERLAVFLRVLAAVDHAHKHLVVHRDLKPSNILVDLQGRPRLLDFGVAKLLAGQQLMPADEHLTQVAGCAVTPRYAAPEQLQDGPITVATDIHALGVILFELLAGVSPYGAGPRSMAQWVQAVTAIEPPRPSRVPLDTAAVSSRRAGSSQRWQRELAGDLDNVVLKALAKDPAQRYGSVEAFAHDIQRFLDHRPVHARRPSVWHRGRLFLRRNLVPASLAALALALTLPLAALAWQQHHATQAQRQRADTVRDFMFDLVDDAEADERQPGTEPTGRQMVKAAVERARQRFHDQPRMRGEVLVELGRMLGRLGDDALMASLLEESVSLLAAQAPDSDAALNKARAYLASVKMGTGQTDDALRLASLALHACTEGSGCAKARFYACTALSQLSMRRGDLDGALAYAGRGVTDARSGFGATDSETALAWLAHAIVARQAGRLDLAQDSLQKARALSRDAFLRRSDRLALHRTEAVLHMDLGQFEQARQALGEALSADMPAADRSMVLRLLATVQLARGEATAALASAMDAQALAAPTSLEIVLARQARARALSLLGDASGAEREMEAVLAGLGSKGFSAASMEVLRARRYLAESLLRNDQVSRGLEHLTQVAEAQAAVQASQPVEYAQTLDLLGNALRQSGRLAQALAAHREAAALLEKRLPANHPFRERNLVYSKAVESLVSGRDTDGLELKRRLDAYASRFPPGSRWRVDIKDIDARCGRAGIPACQWWL